MTQRMPWYPALAASLATVIVAIVWLRDPGTYPYGSDDIVRTGLNFLIEREPAIVIALTAGAVGVVLAVVGMSRPGTRLLAPASVLEVLCFAFVLGDGSAIAALGYLIAMTLPVTAVVATVLVGRRWPRAGIALAALIIGGLAVLGDAFASYYGHLLSGPTDYYSRMAWTFGWLTAAACWGWAAVTSSGRTPAAWATAAARRWGRGATLAAAMCPIPYGLCRLTWITPWPLGGHGIDEFVISRDLEAAERLQGFLFAPAVAVGVVLTLGLISRWGEVFPRWLPGVGRHPVPVMLAVVPGGIVAAVLTLAGPVTIVDLVEYGDLAESTYGFFFMPYPVWGPLLGLAVFAYWLRRTQTSAVWRDRLEQPAVRR